jgi:hypothetical protein
LVNVDFADVRAIMQNAGSSLMGIGTATGIIFGIFFSSINMHSIGCTVVVHDPAPFFLQIELTYFAEKRDCLVLW